MGMTSVELPIYLLVCALIALALCDFVAGLMVYPRMHVVAALPARTVTGQPVRARVQVTNRRRVPAFDVSVSLHPLDRNLAVQGPAQVVPLLWPGESGTLELEVVAHRRGAYVLPPWRAYSTFPFNLNRMGHRVGPPGKLLVTPEYHSLRHVDIPAGARYQPGGVVLSSHVGESPEYIGNREYVPGDSARHIDFKAWARVAQPVVREYQEEYYSRVALVLDTYRPMPMWERALRAADKYLELSRTMRRGEPAEPALEAALSLTASIAEALTRGESIIDLFAAGPDLYVFRAGRGTAHVDNILEILASVEASHTNPIDTLLPSLTENLPSMSAVICILLGWDGLRERVVQSAAEAGCAVKAVFICEDLPPAALREAGEWAASVVHFTPAQVADGAFDAL